MHLSMATMWRCCLLCSTVLWVGAGQAAVVKVAGERAGHWEASFMLNYLGGDTLEFRDGEGKTKNDMGWGLGFHYNFNAHWNLGFDMAWNRPDFDIEFRNIDTGDIESIDHTASRFDGQVNAQYNILPGDFSPYIQAGIGWTYMDSNVVQSLSTICGGWYWPYCRTYANTFDDTSFSYNLGLGLRWDVTDTVFLKAAYIQQWVDTDGDPSPQTGRMEIGFMF